MCACVYSQSFFSYGCQTLPPHVRMFGDIYLCVSSFTVEISAVRMKKKYHRGKGTTTMCYYIRVSILLSLSLRHPTIFNRHMYQTGQIFGTLTEYRLKITSHTSTNLKKIATKTGYRKKSPRYTRRQTIQHPCDNSQSFDQPV